ncbi:MAG: beta-lactamase family protein [Bacteroidetes bacterium]|nr:beta-lactamase family protein [Bacteroidota bacterium]MBU1579907.1 beta-lactamase family protein [Bacteroidota bacterium]MBU2556995.1 beta-lactamase family protein [Bacteroidota bacterium]
MKHFTYLKMAVILAFFLISCEKETSLPEINPFPEDLKMKIEHAVDEVFIQSNTPGIIALVAIEGYDDLIVNRGVSDIVSQEPMHESHYFRIASNTKTFTGQAVLMLADEGMISLDRSITHYLPEYNIPRGDEITVRMLGQMRSGLFDYSYDEGLGMQFLESNFLMTFPPDSLLAIAFRHPQNFNPGEGYQYCNTNIVLLGLLLEKVTGESADQVIYDKILNPLQLLNTYWGSTYFLSSPYCRGYNYYILGEQTDATNWNPSYTYTAGQMVSTIHDMKKWAKLNAEGVFLSDAMKAERFNFGPEGYGFCMMKANDNWIGHEGIIMGYNSEVFYNAAKKTTLVLYSNTNDDLPAHELLAKLVPLLGL